MLWTFSNCFKYFARETTKQCVLLGSLQFSLDKIIEKGVDIMIVVLFFTNIKFEYKYYQEVFRLRKLDYPIGYPYEHKHNDI